jgi:hypothetical protein
MRGYHIDNLDSAVRNLNDLIEVICEVQFEFQAGKHDPRLDSLLWITRDLSEGIVRALDDQNEGYKNGASA